MKYNYTMTEFLHYIEDTINIKTKRNHSRNEPESWTGSASIEDSINKARFGDTKLTKKLKDATEELIKNIHTDTNMYVPDVQGEFFEVSKVVIGEPEAYYHKTYDKNIKPKVEISINMATRNGVKASTMLENAIYLLFKIRELELSGVDVKLVAHWIVDNINMKDSKEVYDLTIVLKEYGEFFNYAKIGGAIHISFLRRLIFRHEEVVFNTLLKAGYGIPLYGRYDIDLAYKNTIDEYFSGIVEKLN